MEFIGDVARKRGKPADLALEVAKTACAAGIAARSGRFHVPAVVRFDAAAGVLDTERVPGFTSLMQLVVRRDPCLVGVCARVGMALADVHAQMQLPAELRIPFPEALAGEPPDDAVLHGDLNGSNVGYDPATDRVVIVDWSAAPSLRVAASVGTRYFDLLWFALFFFRFRPGRALIGWTPELWAGAFVSGYARASGRFSADALRAYHERVRRFVLDDYRVEQARRRGGFRRLTYRAWQRLGWRRWEKFLAALEDSQAGP